MISTWKTVHHEEIESLINDEDKLSDITNPISSLYQNTFKITKWVLIFFAFSLGLYPLLQKIIQFLGIRHWRQRDLLSRYICGACIAIVAAFAFLEFQPLAVYLFSRIKASLALTNIIGGADKALAIIGSLILVLSGLITTDSISKGAKISARIGLYAMAIIGPLVLWIFYLNFCLWAFSNKDVPQMFTNTEGYVLWVYLGVAFITYSTSRQLYNVNQTSFHPFYRDRLSQTFLITTDKHSGNLKQNDEQKLHQLDCYFTPYHILNTTLNITGNSTVNLKGRQADFFSFSRDYVDSRITGYARTQSYEAQDPHMGLGTAMAMAISGAAVAPNMGRETNRSITFIMALLNIRLRYWAKNPKLLGPMMNKSTWHRFHDHICPNQVGPFFLLNEMLGLTNEKSRFVNLSDGGHLENMGLYELVRRRCKFIIICDAEADKEMTCHGLADAIRMVLIDMGIKIHIDLNNIYRKKYDSYGTIKIVGEKHYAIGTVEYGQGKDERGYLLYIKSSVSRKHTPYINDYLARHCDFPHETTADHFFDEAQFEAYRALGWEVGDQTLKEISALSEQSLNENITSKNNKDKLFAQARSEWKNLFNTTQNTRRN